MHTAKGAELFEGPVAICDILGYRQLAASNQLERTARIIKDNLLRIPDMVPDAVAQLMTEENRRLYASHRASLRSLVFSDTVLLSVPLPSNAPLRTRVVVWAMFLSYVAMLHRTTLDAGLPMRGAIAFGQQFIAEYCFAGEPIIAAYSLANRLEFSGCAFVEGCIHTLHDHLGPLQPRTLFTRLVFPYDIPFKDAQRREGHLLNWLQPTRDWGEPPKDVRRSILDSFAQHDKEIPPEVMPKVENTEEILKHSLTGQWEMGEKDTGQGPNDVQ